MTVCIAAIAEDGKKAVLVADKLGTNQGLLPSQADNLNKIFKINENVSVMFSGSVTDAEIVVSRVKRTLGSKKWVTDIAEYFNQKYLDYLLEVLELQYVEGRGIKGGIQTFYHDKNLNLSTEERREIANVLGTYTLASNTSFILCGKDNSDTYKIYSCGPNPRIHALLVTNGYATIGNGALYAQHSILFSEYSPALDSAAVKAILVEAKKKAEKSYDVGEKEDVEVLV